MIQAFFLFSSLLATCGFNASDYDDYCPGKDNKSPCYERKRDLSEDIPVIDLTEQQAELQGFTKEANVAQYGLADWKNVIGIARNISLFDAFMIAKSNPKISFFFYTKGYQMVLDSVDGNCRIFRHGDTVFFSGKPWWGTAPGLADGYVKKP